MRSPDLGRLTSRFSRDAVHMAVIPVTAGERLNPGAPVALSPVGNAILSPIGDAVGVVDPFLPESVAPGGRFWLLLKPGSVEGLRHDWSHPLFPNRTAADAAEADKSERWLRDFIGNAEIFGDTFEEVIADLIAGNGGTIYGRSDAQPDDEFWFHFERFTGTSALRGQSFDCQC